MARYFTMLILLSVAASSAARAAGTAKDSFQKIRPLLFQLSTSAQQDAEKKAYGTGFVIDAHGLLITNFHVVADAVNEPETAKIYLIDNTESTPVDVVDFDVIHDLALIRVPREFSSQIRIASEAPDNGDTIFSLGLPEDLDWTVVSGIYNGVIDQKPYELIHLSAPLNSGMSGGPTVNDKSELVGVNVSGYVSSQNISFSIPAKYAVKLLADYQARTDKDQPFDPTKKLESQLTSLQEILTRDLLASAKGKKDLYGWKIPKAPSYVRCWGTQNKSAPKTVKSYSETCGLTNQVHVDDDIALGHYRLGHLLNENSGMSPFSFMRYLGLDWDGLTTDDWNYFDEKRRVNPGQKTCLSRKVNVATRQVVAEACYRPILPLKDLYQATLKFFTRQGNEKAQTSIIELNGFSRKSIVAILETYLKNFGEVGRDKH